MVRKAFRKIKLIQFKHLLYVFLLCTIVLAAVNRITAQTIGSPTLFETTDKYFATPYSNSIVDLQTSKEIEVLTGGECSGNRLGGMVGELVDSAAEIFGIPQGTSTYNNCALTQLAKGDPELYLAMFNNSSPGLYPTVFALNLELLNQRPASGTGFVEEKVYALQNAFTANAQSEPQLYYPGTGFDLLRPMQSFWGWIVNIVYGLMILIIIFVAFGIMFRAQLPGGTAITIQNSIPNIALAMVLIPLSYAITGLFIDGITIGVNVSHQLLLGAGSPGREVYIQREDNFPRTGRIGGEIEDRGLYADDERVSWLYSSSYVNIRDEFGDGIPAITQSFIGNDLGALQGLLDFIAPLVNLAIGILLLFTGLRIFVLLFKKYLSFMILGPLTSPLVFASVAIPGNGTKSIVEYAKMMGSGTLSFIAAYSMIILAMILSTATFQANLAQAGITQYQPPLFGFEFATQVGGIVDTGVNSFILGLMALGVYLMIPPTLKNIDAAMGVTGALPSFITDTWQSAKDSFNLAKSTASYSGKAIKNYNPVTLTGKVNRQRIRINQAARNFLDTARGRRPGEIGTGLYNKIKQKENEIENAEARRRKAVEQGGAGGLIRAQIAEAEIAGYKRELEVLKATPGASKDIENPTDAKLVAQLAWAGKPIYEFEEWEVQDMIDRMVALRTINPGNTGITLTKAGKFTLKLEGKSTKFPPGLRDKLSLYTVTSSSNKYTSGEKEAGAAVPTIVASVLTSIDMTNHFKVISGGQVASLEFEDPLPPNPAGDGVTYEVSFDLEINDLPSFLRSAVSLGLLISTPGIIKLENYGYGNTLTSNPFDLRFKLKISQAKLETMLP